MDAEAVQRMYRAGKEQWPGVDLPFQSFAEHCARVLAEGGHDAEAYAAELYLCCACASGIAEATYAFEREVGGAARSAIARINHDPDFVQEVLQELWNKL